MDGIRRTLRKYIVEVENSWKENYFLKLPDEEREDIEQIILLASARAALTCCDAIQEERTLAQGLDNITRLGYYWLDRYLSEKTTPEESKEFFFGYLSPDSMIIKS